MFELPRGFFEEHTLKRPKLSLVLHWRSATQCKTQPQKVHPKKNSSVSKFTNFKLQTTVILFRVSFFYGKFAVLYFSNTYLYFKCHNVTSALVQDFPLTRWGPPLWFELIICNACRFCMCWFSSSFILTSPKLLRVGITFL